MTTKDSEYYINLLDKAAARFQRTPLLKEVLLLVKWYQTASHATEKWFMKEESVDVAHFTAVLFKELPQPPQPSVITTLISQRSSTSRQDSLPEKEND